MKCADLSDVPMTSDKARSVMSLSLPLAVCNLIAGVPSASDFATRSAVRSIWHLCNCVARATLRDSAARMICSCSPTSLRVGNRDVIESAT